MDKGRSGVNCDTNPYIPIAILEVDPDGLAETLTAFDEHPDLRPCVPEPDLDVQLSQEAYTKEMRAEKFPRLGTWQHFQIEQAFEELERLRSEKASRPWPVYTLEGEDPNPRDGVLLNLWLAFLNQGHAPYIEDKALGDRRFVARLVI